MHWSWYLVFSYLAFCAIGWIAVFRSCPNAAADKRLPQLLKAYPVRVSLGLVLAALVVGPLLPLVLAYGVWMRRSALREWDKFSRTFRPVQFEAIHPANLPQDAQDHIESCTPILAELGFVSAVTCQLKPEPNPVLAHCLLSRDGETQADLSWIFGSNSVSFISVLEDGHVLETSCMEESMPQDDLDRINRSGCFTTQSFAAGEGGNFADEAFLLAAYRGHLERLAELEERSGCGTLHIAADEIPTLKRYENAVFGQWQFDQGEVDNRPEPQPRPRGIVRRIAEPLCTADSR